MILLRALLIPVAGLLVALAVLIGARAGQVMAVISAVMFGVAGFLVLMGA
jgi:hypothetical protein